MGNSMEGSPNRKPEYGVNIKQKSDRLLPIALLGASEGTRTPDLLVRSQSLYPAELQTHVLESALLL